MNNSNAQANKFVSYLIKSKILYKISFWYGIVCLVLSLISIVLLFTMLYPEQGVNIPKFLSTNSVSSNILWLLKLLKDPIYYSLIALIPLLMLKGKANINKMTDIAAGIISVAACIGVIIIIIGLISGLITFSLIQAIYLTAAIKGYTYPILPIASLIACILFVVSYVNEKFDESPKKYLQIILPALGLLILIIDVIASYFHIY